MDEAAVSDDPVSSTGPRRLAAADVAASGYSTRTILVRTGPGMFDREVRIRSHEIACLVAAALGVAIGVVTILWFENAWTWLDPCRDTPADMVCDTPTAWFRWPQFAAAALGLASGATISIYLVRFAFVGKIWRNSRSIAIIHGVIVVVWLFIWALGTITR